MVGQRLNYAAVLEQTKSDKLLREAMNSDSLLHSATQSFNRLFTKNLDGIIALFKK